MLSPYHLRGVKLTQRENRRGEKGGGHVQAHGCLGPLKSTPKICLQGTQQTPFHIFREEPISSLAGDFPFRSLLGRTLLFATTHCSGKRTVGKCKASSRQQLLCDKASLSVQLWEFRKTRGSQGRWVGGTSGRGTHRPGVPVCTFYPLPGALPQLPAPTKCQQKHL